MTGATGPGEIIDGELWRPLMEFGAGPGVAHAAGVWKIEEPTEFRAWGQLTAVALHTNYSFDRYVLHLPWEKNPIPSNGSHGHWRTHAAQVRAVRQTSYALARQLDPKRLDGRIRAELVWHVVDRTKRDAPNLMLVLKALIDGLRTDPKHNQTRGIIADDTPDYIDTLMPRIEYAPRSPDRPRAWMSLTIWPNPV